MGLAKQSSGSKRRWPVVQRVVVHMSLLVKGTWFIRPLTVNHPLDATECEKFHAHSIRDHHYNEN